MNLAEKQLSLTDQVRKSVDRLTNRYDGSQYISLEAALKDFNEKMDCIAVIETRAAACTCQPPAEFEINTRRNNGILDFKANLARAKQVTADEELLFEQKGIRTVAGINEGVGAPRIDRLRDGDEQVQRGMRS